MGAGHSNEQSDEIPTVGYHVVKVSHNSPAQQAQIEAYFDYILFVNNHNLSIAPPNTLLETLYENLDKKVTLILYSTKLRNLRKVCLKPTQSWKGYCEETGIIGCTVKKCDYTQSSSNIWKILSVQPKSPAEQSGLQANFDYILGTPHCCLLEEQDLHTLIEKHVGKPVQLYVYNSKDDCIREVLLMPNLDWGGKGYLGCNIGYGYLHRIPSQNELPEGEPLIIHDHLDDDIDVSENWDEVNEEILEKGTLEIENRVVHQETDQENVQIEDSNNEVVIGKVGGKDIRNDAKGDNSEKLRSH